MSENKYSNLKFFAVGALVALIVTGAVPASSNYLTSVSDGTGDGTTQGDKPKEDTAQGSGTDQGSGGNQGQNQCPSGQFFCFSIKACATGPQCMEADKAAGKQWGDKGKGGGGQGGTGWQGNSDDKGKGNGGQGKDNGWQGKGAECSSDQFFCGSMNSCITFKEGYKCNEADKAAGKGPWGEDTGKKDKVFGKGTSYPANGKDDLVGDGETFPFENGDNPFDIFELEIKPAFKVQHIEFSEGVDIGSFKLLKSQFSKAKKSMKKNAGAIIAFADVAKNLSNACDELGMDDESDSSTEICKGRAELIEIMSDIAEEIDASENPAKFSVSKDKIVKIKGYLKSMLESVEAAFKAQEAQNTED